MWFILMPAMLWNSSVAIWMTLPWPDEAKLTCPGFAFAIAISSCVDFTGSEGRTTISSGPCESWMIGVMSLTGSKVNL
jgi:hypothetical protein